MTLITEQGTDVESIPYEEIKCNPQPTQPATITNEGTSNQNKRKHQQPAQMKAQNGEKE